MSKCSAQLNLYRMEFGRELSYCFHCDLEQGHIGTHRCFSKGWTETFHKLNQQVVVYWFTDQLVKEKKNEETS